MALCCWIDPLVVCLLSIWLRQDISFFEKGKGESETLGGLLIELFGRIPNSNEEISFESFLFRVQSVDTRRIKKIKVTLQQNPTNETV